MNKRWLPVVLVGALLAVGGTGCSTGEDGEPASGPGTWRQLPDPPLSGRVSSVLVGVGDRVLVVGGWTFLCPPNADCSAPPDPLFADGAVYDRRNDSWAPITPAPFGLDTASTVSIDDTAYLLTGCETGPGCVAQPRLLSYDLDEDRWTDHGPVPGPLSQGRALTVVGDTLLAALPSDGRGLVHDLLFDPGTSTWTELPDAPLTGQYDRFFVPVGDQLILKASTLGAPDAADGPATLVARFDLTRQEWIDVPDPSGPGYQLWPTTRGPVLNGHYGDVSGWLLDPGTWTWSALPGHIGEQDDLLGVLDQERATYSAGHLSFDVPAPVYDSRADAILSIPPPPGRDGVSGRSGAALGRDLFLFGGQWWASSDGGLIDDAWLWSAPVG